MRFTSLAAVLVLCACKSGSGGTKDPSSETPFMQQRVEMTRVETPSGIIQIDWQQQRTYDETKLLVPVEKAWGAVPAVYGELGIQPTLVDSKQHVFGNAGANYRRRLGSQRMSHFFDCGSTAGISNADDYDLLIRVITQIIPAEGGLSSVRTQVEATGHATATSGQVVRCASTGALEEQIAHMVSDQAVRAAAK
ncbi:MAG TPA: hypothetical protein VGO46_11495 [Gemmatimonadaceae bacterium]|nr:hypothetical protein [Gemmatimonadaceae bacterium]